MKRLWTIIAGTLVFGLVDTGVRQVVKSHQKETENNTESNSTSKTLLLAVVGVILLLAFSVEVKTFLTQLF